MYKLFHFKSHSFSSALGIFGLVHPSRGISMIFPRFSHQRIDKKPEDGSTPTDIAYLFHHQKRKMDFSIDDQNP